MSSATERERRAAEFRALAQERAGLWRAVAAAGAGWKVTPWGLEVVEGHEPAIPPEASARLAWINEEMRRLRRESGK